MKTFEYKVIEGEKKSFSQFSQKRRTNGGRIKGTFYRGKKLLISQSIKETEFNFIALNAKFVFLLDVKRDG